MPLVPAVAEELLVLLDRYPNLTDVQRVILKSAAAYLVQDEMDRLGLDSWSGESYDPRLKMIANEYHLVPNGVELWNGIVMPKHWATPNRLAAAERDRQQR